MQSQHPTVATSKAIGMGDKSCAAHAAQGNSSGSGLSAGAIPIVYKGFVGIK
eukprot:gene29505-5849_t